MFTVCKRRKLMLHIKTMGQKYTFFLFTQRRPMCDYGWTLWTVTCSRFSFRCIYPIVFNKINNGSMRWTTDELIVCIVSVEKFKRSNSTNDDFISGKMKTPNPVRTSHRHNHQPERKSNELIDGHLLHSSAFTRMKIWNAFNPSHRVAWSRIDESVHHFDHFLYCGME